MIPDYVKSKMADYHNQYSEIAQELFTFWLSDIVFTLPWWIGLLLIVMPWLIWFLCKEKINTHKYLYSGFFVIIISSYLDFLGVQAG
ncbi:hypothetical protein [Bacillus sp. SG-1]|uniref:hypothetical protein n=1 Tax=Bacillus sp. SG-1 TaxID=161544 RepID=UPI0001544D2C|nr:hypothetical protein [Bacillus sp. SG-1]EDL63881.1 hypothetical protein BSG1_13281 [Bacillus sp. SG-1]